MPVSAASSVSVDQTELHFGDHFTVSYQTNTPQPWALARCYPNGSSVYSGVNADGSFWGEWFSVYPGGPSPQNFILGDSVSPLWTGGGADCTVDLYKLSGKYLGAQGFQHQDLLAETAFTVAP